MVGVLQVVQQMVTYAVEERITEEQAFLAIKQALRRARSGRDWARGEDFVEKPWVPDTVREVGQKVAQAAGQYALKQGGEMAAWWWRNLSLQGAIVADPNPNMGVRGGQTPWGMQAVVVTTEGFLQMVEEDLPSDMFSDAIAAVLAHEFAHLVYRTMGREDKGPQDEAEEFDADSLGVEIAEAAGFMRAREGAILSLKAAALTRSADNVLARRIQALEVR